MTKSAQPAEITPDLTTPTEHQRFAEYLHALAMVPDAEEIALVDAVLGDPDRVMAESAVVRHLDTRAAALHGDPEFSTWARRMAGVVDLHPFVAERLRAWSLISVIALNAAWSPDELVAASDWTQRKVAESTKSTDPRSVRTNPTSSQHSQRPQTTRE